MLQEDVPAVNSLHHPTLERQLSVTQFSQIGQERDLDYFEQAQ